RREEKFFLDLAKGQAPDTLFFTCSDSRVDPNLITQSKPGELFIVKNVGNIIPLCNDLFKKTCTAAAIEFALNLLNISSIVVCGHSSCGGVRAMFRDPKDFTGMENLKEWIATAKVVKEKALEKAESACFDEIISIAEKEHIKTQLEHLKTYPLVQNALNEGKVALHGWHYEIATGIIYSYDERNDCFEKIDHNENHRSADADPFEEPCGDLG
ncbi:MAG: carbonic anhydrase, partial [Deltaproteobacteria bacterium]|nr:carbonic anhydrase [Deltaproteobacteria bacterium]